MIENIPTYSYQDVKDGEVDCIVIASGYHYLEMKKNVGHLRETKIFSLYELLRLSQGQDSVLKINGV